MCMQERIHLESYSTCVCENDEYFESIINKSVVTCDEIIEPTKNTAVNFGAKKLHVKWIISIIILALF